MSYFVAPQQLHDLAFRYALAVDTLDAELLASLFSSEGVVRGFGVNPIEFKGIKGLSQMVAQVDSAFQKTMHNVFNQTFERDENGLVTGHTNCIASHIMRGEDWILLDMAIRYHNQYAKQDGEWRFAERRLEVLWVETRPVQKFTADMMNNDLKAFQ